MTDSSIIEHSDLILVTGSNGFIGTRVVESLLSRGYRNLRCFVRPSSRLQRLRSIIVGAGAEGTVQVVAGDLLSREDCQRAAEGVAVVYHLAAGIDKSFAGAFMGSALGTRNLMDAFLKFGRPVRFVNVSSFAVYSNATLRRGAVLDETCPLETSHQARNDAYGFGKLKQEELVRQYGATHRLKYVILRPGTVFGPGNPSLTGRIGIDTFGFFIHVGGGNLLPLTYVDNCADAIVLAGLVPGVEGEIFNVVDDELLTSRQFLRAYKNRTGWFLSLPLPYYLAYLLCGLWESYSNRSRGHLPPVFNRQRCASEWKGNRFPNAKIREGLGWAPAVDNKQAMERFLEQFPERTTRR